MSEDLTIKQRKWIKLYLKYGNATKAAREVYDCANDDSAAVIGYENLRKLNYQDFLEEAGITDELLQKKMIEGLESTKPISALVLVNTEKGTSKTKADEGQIEVPDYAIRHKYLETVLKLKKRLVDKMEVDANVNVTFNLDEIIGLSNATTKTTDSATKAV